MFVARAGLRSQRLYRTATLRRFFASSAAATAFPATESQMVWAAAACAATLACAATVATAEKTRLDNRYPAGGGDVVQTGTPVKEPGTGILYPQLCNGYYLAGCGVRVKYGFVKVYAVGTYLDPLAMSAVKKRDKGTIEQALLDPTYPRTIRIVMNRALSMDKYISAIVEALEPRMKGQDLGTLEEFKKLNPPIDLVKGAEMELTIRGDTMLYKNATGGVGTIRSAVFTRAMCDVFYGADPVSPTHKDAVLDGVPKL